MQDCSLNELDNKLDRLFESPTQIFYILSGDNLSYCDEPLRASCRSVYSPGRIVADMCW